RGTAELQRIRAEQQLSESEARYRDLFDNAPNAYWLVGTDGRVLHANRRAAELLGRPLEEMVGSLTPSFGADTPEGRPRILEVRRKHLAGASVSGGRPPGGNGNCAARTAPPHGSKWGWSLAAARRGPPGPPVPSA